VYGHLVLVALLNMFSSCGGISKAVYIHEIITEICEVVVVLKACTMQHETVDYIFSNHYIE